MSPRPYRLGQRQAATEQTRTRILTATRELLMASDGFSGFSIDAVARQADVARMTVYHQFGSKIGLLEALSDSLAAHGGMEQLANAFRRSEPLDTLDEYIRRIEKYSFWGAAQNWKDGKRSGFMPIFGRSLWRFIRTYIFQLGILDGMHGLVFCMLQGYGTYLKWALLWGWHVNAARGRQPSLPIFDEDETTWRSLEEGGAEGGTT